MKWLNWLKKLFWEKEETSLFYMQGHDVLPQPLSREEEEEALIAWENGDEAARSRLIEHNLRLVAVSYTHLDVYKRQEFVCYLRKLQSKSTKAF